MRIIVPNGTGIRPFTPRQAQANSPDAIFARQASDQLTAVRDAEAMQKLADGHTEAFANYAQERIGKATSPAEKAYWQHLADRSQQKLEDDNLAAGVKDGSATLEQVRDHLKDRATAVGPTHPEYASYVGELGKVQDAIKARDFNADITKAQQNYYTSGDKSAYKNDLVGFLSRATDSAAHSALLTQITNVQASIDRDEVTKRVGAATQQITDAYQGEAKPRDVIAFLDKQAGTAKTEQEAQWYANEATKLAAYDRQQQRDAIAKAGASTSTAALRSTLLDANDSLRTAETAVHSEIIRKGQPSDATWQAFASAHKDYADALAAALPGATAKNADAIIKEQARVTSQYDIQFKEVGAAVVKSAEDAATQLAGTAKSFTSQTEKGDYSAVSAARYQWAKALSDATSSPFLNDAQKRALQDKITTGPLAEQAADIQRNLAGLNEPQAPSKASDKPMRGEYEKYTNAFDNAPQRRGTQSSLPGPVSYDDFLKVAGSNKTYDQIKVDLFGSKAPAATWPVSSIRDLKNDVNDYNTALDNENQAFGDKNDRHIAAIVQLTKSQQTGPADLNLTDAANANPNFAAEHGTFDPSKYGPILPPDPNSLMAGNTMDASGRLIHGGPVAGLPASSTEPPPEEASADNALSPGYESMFGDTSNADITAFDSGSQASDSARMSAHLLALNTLDEPTAIDLPNYEFPQVSFDQPFLSPDAISRNQDFNFPAAPDASMPPPPAVGDAFPDMPSPMLSA